MTAYRTVKSSELQPGDIVNCHGMRCLIDQEIKTYNGSGGRLVYNTRALVLNRDDVPGSVVPIGWTATDGNGQENPNGEHRWTIQGNDGAYWAVEVETNRYVVIENTPGYLPEDDDPPVFDRYADAVQYLNDRAAEYADDPDANYRVEYGIASGDNLAAVIVHDDDSMHDLGRTIQILIDQEDN